MACLTSLHIALNVTPHLELKLHHLKLNHKHLKELNNQERKARKNAWTKPKFYMLCKSTRGSGLTQTWVQRISEDSHGDQLHFKLRKQRANRGFLDFKLENGSWIQQCWRGRRIQLSSTLLSSNMQGLSKDLSSNTLTISSPRSLINK